MMHSDESDTSRITAWDLAPIVLGLRDAWDEAEDVREPHQFDRPTERLIEWAEWVMQRRPPQAGS
jgi:hypothetical protein